MYIDELKIDEGNPSEMENIAEFPFKKGGTIVGESEIGKILYFEPDTSSVSGQIVRYLSRNPNNKKDTVWENALVDYSETLKEHYVLED